ncbi:MAG: UDP-N-acetylglucosamine--N-acetylmuramyl-(pentapeptide) pyrophosphoryl-undecaprenol N-acetylglucosamine transferase [Alphaproteobacteria bacterium]|nr:UDP-N-acetylglucosamine--N-acetylmuramyl-(pentapeptide) pyrophosphoryl-undecaprenol N-acetylglucosamine transferase [Alphaproteobacteria bacterium]
MKIVLCAGGTGGHLFPVVALYSSFKKKGHLVSIVTDKRGVLYCDNVKDKEVIGTLRFSLKGIVGFFVNSIQIFLNFLIKWRKNRPDVFIGFGGIMTIIPALIAKLYGIKLVIYEQNSIVGRANRYLLKLADLHLSTFALGGVWKMQSAPVRKEFFQKSAYKLSNKINILVIGGSQGAKSFSSMIPEAIEKMTRNERVQISVVQQNLCSNTEDLKTKYEKMGVEADIRDFIHDMATPMKECQLVICRSGASTLAELSAVGRPAVLIPYPLATDNHQLLNAKRYEQKGAAWIVEEGKNSVIRLKSFLSKFLKHPELLQSAASNIKDSSLKNAADDFVKIIEKLGNQI